MKILMPVDLVHPIDPTIDLLNELCDLSSHEVRLLYVRELLPAYESVIKTAGSFPDDWEKGVDRKANEHLSEFLIRLKPHCKSVSTEITRGTVAAMVATVASDEDQDLIVVAPGQHSALERLFAGSVSGRVLDRSDRPVLVARPSANSTDTLKNVVVGFDGSDSSKWALERALALFKVAASGAKVTVVHSVNVAEPVKFLSPVEFVAAVEQNLLMLGETYLAQAEKVLSDNGVKDMDCCLIEGDPAAGIIKMANDSQADLIIVGARGHGTFTDHLLGSVSHKVAMHAQCTVAVMKQPSEKTD